MRSGNFCSAKANDTSKRTDPAFQLEAWSEPVLWLRLRIHETPSRYVPSARTSKVSMSVAATRSVSSTSGVAMQTGWLDPVEGELHGFGSDLGTIVGRDRLPGLIDDHNAALKQSGAPSDCV